MFYNPAYAGAKGGICGTVLGRFQWNGLPGAPNTWLFTADMPIPIDGGNWNNNSIGLGITGYGDYIGFQEDYGLKLAATYRRHNLGPGNLAVGIDIGFQSRNFRNQSWVWPNTVGEPGFGVTNLAPFNQMGFDFSAGVYYHGSNFYGGISALHLTGSDFNTLNVKQARHMYFTGGYTFENLFGGSWAINPNVIVKTDFANASFDINCNMLYDVANNHKLIFGATYRYIDAIGINAGWQMTGAKNTFLLAYNYDINTSRLNAFNSGTHEIMLRFCYKVEKIVDIIPRYNVRFGDTMGKRY